ncbi:MAG: lipoate--protein ligase family protein [Candidatus Krumholzibacteriota bacterium]|nr:lipoate--protein ligase family protein [Candidatus Krumholzibacteriota bacterium]
MDRTLFDALEAGRGEPTLRLYAWSPWTVSLGVHQDPASALDLTALAARGWGWVHRPTGGRAVLHAEEITYAVAAPLTGPFAGGLAETHRRIGRALVRFYAACGVAAELTRPAPAAELDPRSPTPCFASPGLAELEADGRKLAGSAQRRGRRAFLQHGSLLLGTAHRRLAEVLPLPAPARERLRASLAARAAALGELVPSLSDQAVLRERLAAAFAEEFDLDWLDV